MKKLLQSSIAILLFSIAFSSIAQITVNSSHILSVGNKVYQVRDSLPINTNPGPAGANQTWSFTNLNVHVHDSIEAVLPSSTPYGSQFPSSNLTFVQGGAYVYLNNQPSELNILGVYVPDFNVVLPYSNPEKIMVFPATYQTAYADTAVAQAQIAGSAIGQPSIDSIRVKQVKHRSGMVDAWGSLTTDEGTFNTLRLKDTIFQYDTVWIKVGFFPWQELQAQLTITYETSWITDDDTYGLPLLTISDDGTGVDVTWLTKSNPCSAPANNASGISFNSVTHNAATINWTNGDGGARIVVMRAGASVSATPVDGQTYPANSAYGDANSALGSGFVVYDGTGTSVNVTNLSPNTTYYVSVFEYNCSPKYYQTNTFDSNDFITQNNIGIAGYNSRNEALRVYPNPVGMSQNIYLNKKADVTVYNVLGKMVFSKQNATSIETNELSKGVYFMVSSEGEKVKFIVE
jgi:hypothetical protein